MSDYIERADAINLLWFFADESCASVVSDFEALPAADVAPVIVAEWGERPARFLPGGVQLYCTHCGKPFGYRANYCAYCGAKMDFTKFKASINCMKTGSANTSKSTERSSQNDD